MTAAGQRVRSRRHDYLESFSRDALLIYSSINWSSVKRQLCAYTTIEMTGRKSWTYPTLLRSYLGMSIQTRLGTAQ